MQNFLGQGCRPTEGVSRGSGIQRTQVGSAGNLPIRSHELEHRMYTALLESVAWGGGSHTAITCCCPVGPRPMLGRCPVPGWIKTPVLWMIWSQHSRQLTSTPHPGSASLCLVQKHICLAMSVATGFILIFVILAILLNLRA